MQLQIHPQFSRRAGGSSGSNDLVNVAELSGASLTIRCKEQVGLRQHCTEE